MKVLCPAPFAVGFLHWRFDPKQDSLVFAVKGSFRLQNGARAEPLDEALPITGDVFTGEEPDNLGGIGGVNPACVYPSDVVPFKPKADALLVGKAHTGKAVTQCDATFAVGSASLTLRVIGDRTWLDDGRATEPLPFKEMDLTYERAFGGRDWITNPVGRGTDSKVRRLPNVEDPNALIRRVTDRPAPASFGPLSPLWGYRMAQWPSITPSAIEDRWPWAPAELDYRYFNSAQPALQTEFFQGNETLRCENLHREHRRFTCRLPGLRPRLFMVDRQGKQERFQEVGLVLDTLWVDMEAERLVLVWRGKAPVASIEFEEVEHAYVAVEQMTEPRLSAQQHRQIFELTRTENAGAPPAPLAPVAEKKQAPEPKTPSRSPETLRADGLPAQVRQKLIAIGTPAEIIDALDRGDVQGARDLTIKQLGLSDADLTSNILRLKEQEKEAREAKGSPARTPRPGHSPIPVSTWTRARVEQALSSDVSLVGVKLDDLDLSGLDLTGRDLTSCLMKGANLAGATFVGAVLDGANLSKANAAEASFRQASLLDADLTGLAGQGADFSEAKLEGALLDQASLQKAKFAGCHAAKTSFSQSQLEGADFSGADLQGALLERAKIDRVKFTGAKLDGAVAEGVTGDSVDFEKASLVGFRAGENSSLVGAKLAGCRAERSRWMGADLRLAQMTRATLAQADLSRTNLEGAKLSGTDCQKADFTKANLTRANLSGANLTAAQLEAADLHSANLQEACLYQAQLWRARLTDANLTGAFTAGTLLEAPVRGWAR